MNPFLGTWVANLEKSRRHHPVSPQAPGVVAVTIWIGTHVLATEAIKDGRAVGKAYEVSGDGRTLTATVGGVDAAGKPFDQIIVFDRST
jgi:hypothetical protein